MENIKEIIAKNLVELRKSRKYTQQNLADKLGYSDKAVSRWEHGESLPDIETLCKICDIYGVKFEYLLQEEQPLRRNPYVKKDDSVLAKIMITLIAVCSVWLLATVIYTYTYEASHNWMLFIWALPVTGAVLAVCNRMWGKKFFGAFISSFIVWTFILSVFLQFLEKKMFMFFIIGVPIQLIIIFAAILQRNKRRALQTAGRGGRRDDRD